MGINPVTKQQAFALEYVKNVPAVMFTCGLYDYASEWAYRVGLPAKSGVGGGIVAVVNRQLGIAVCKELALHLGLHAFEFTNVGSSFMEWLTAAK